METKTDQPRYRSHCGEWAFDRSRRTYSRKGTQMHKHEERAEHYRRKHHFVEVPAHPVAIARLDGEQEVGETIRHPQPAHQPGCLHPFSLTS
jgi:hypothetical protein